MMDSGRHAILALIAPACCVLSIPAGAASVLRNNKTLMTATKHGANGQFRIRQIECYRQTED